MTVGELESVLTNICMQGLSNAKILIEYSAQTTLFDEAKNPKVCVFDIAGEKYIKLFVYIEN